MSLVSVHRVKISQNATLDVQSAELMLYYDILKPHKRSERLR